nr:snake venom serine proteinase 12-like [Onthophagus taurus]
MERCYKYLGIIKNNDEVICTGTLLSQDWVLTSEQCCLDLNPKTAHVGFGLLIWRETNFISKILSVVFNQDLCLIKLKESILENRVIKYGNVTDSYEIANCDISFMARLEKNTRNNERSVKCEKMVAVEKSECGKINDDFGCTKNAFSSITADCILNRGGPIMCNDNVQIGVITKILGCDEKGYLIGYTTLKKHLLFIQRVINGTISIKNLNLRSSSQQIRMSIKRFFLKSATAEPART